MPSAVESSETGFFVSCSHVIAVTQCYWYVSFCN